MVYEKVSSDMNFVDREKQVEKFWKDNDIFQKSIDNRKKGETYTFYDGPPTANGKPHIGHVLTRVIKDMIPRYRTMKGCMVLSLSSRNVRKAYGNTRVCGRISHLQLVSGLIWITHISHTMITSLSLNGGL